MLFTEQFEAQQAQFHCRLWKKTFILPRKGVETQEPLPWIRPWYHPGFFLTSLVCSPFPPTNSHRSPPTPYLGNFKKILFNIRTSRPYSATLWAYTFIRRYFDPIHELLEHKRFVLLASTVFTRTILDRISLTYSFVLVDYTALVFDSVTIADLNAQPMNYDS